MGKRRVVVTGLGAITPLGNSVNEFWNNALAGKSGIGPITHFDTAQFDSKIAGEIRNFDPSSMIDRKEARHMDLFVQYTIMAAKEALEQSGLDMEKSNRERFGAVIGTGIGGISMLENQHEILLNRGPNRCSPFLIPMMIPNIAAGHLAIKLGLEGPSGCTVTACASGNSALADATRWIQYGDADVMFAGGAESAVCPTAVAGFCAAKALSVRNGDPAHASRPFDKDRDGFVIGEGAGVVVVEALEHAQARGAKILAEIVGIGQSDDAYHITAPHPEGLGAARAMQNALRDGGITPEQVDYINAHGTSTGLGDIGETKAIKRIFGDRAYKTPISSTKSMVGHCLGAAGGIEFIAVVKSLLDQKIHPTANLDNPDPECDLDYVPKVARSLALTYGLSNSFGFGGHNASVLVKRFEP
jgi:3-oxoacyl-[acyl-carrier-protein] synthase II